MRKIGLYFATIAACIGLIVIIQNNKTSAPATNQQPASNSGDFDRKKLSTSDPNSFWVIVNKQRPLQPKDFAPNDLRTPSVALRGSSTNEEMKLRSAPATAIERMFTDAKADGISLLLVSGYRSFALQTSVYNRYVTTQGQATADTQSARPGYSEHQTGLAVDVGSADRSCELAVCFADSAAGKWVAANAYKYGFLVRYQSNTQNIVGYVFEPWHLRFVGTELASEINKQNDQPLESFFGLPKAPTY